MNCELLAPAGDLDAAYAAFHYGADAVYLGLKRFSARAEAANFTTDELGEIVAFAHAAPRRRSVFVALNTLVSDGEIDDAIESLATVSDSGADAVIIQDLGLARLVRKYFPKLALHASTQMAIHNAAGAVAARELGFNRVTLARELTLGEVGAIVREGGLDVETFIHGALCYSYSGLCLYSSMLRGRSGNRGRCGYPCRDTFSGASGSVGGNYPFSMKDLALTADILKLRENGVFSFKIEGRKKSALYVAAVTSYYRNLLDKRLSPAAQREAEEDIKTIFSRPWTDLYVKSARNRAVTDAEVVGHRGAPIGTVQEIIRQGRVEWLRFKTQRRLERHDGIQTDVPGQGRPFGLPVDRLRVLRGRGQVPEEVFEADAHELVEVALPLEHPEIEAGAPLYCSSSQEVKQRYRFPRPKPGAFRVRQPVHVVVSVNDRSVSATVWVAGGGGRAVVSLDGVFEPGRNPSQIGMAGRQAFEKLGETAFELKEFRVDNPGGLFVPVSLLNRLRRDVMQKLGAVIGELRRTDVEAIQVKEQPGDSPALGSAAATGDSAGWSLKVDRVGSLTALDADNWAGLEEAVVDIGRDSHDDLMRGLLGLEASVPREKIRLALPVMTRGWERSGLEMKVSSLQAAGWRNWEAAVLSAWPFLKIGGPDIPSDLSLTADWPIYAMNRSAVRQLFDMGVTRFTLSPESGREELRPLLEEYGERATVVIYQDTPLFISENCALAAMFRKCPAGSDCIDSERDWESGSGEKVRLVQQGCRSVLINRVPFCLGQRLDELRGMGARHFRADFINRHYEPQDVRRLWGSLRRGDPVKGHEGNFREGIR